jgi:hypothetical protein
MTPVSNFSNRYIGEVALAVSMGVSKAVGQKSRRCGFNLNPADLRPCSAFTPEVKTIVGANV